MTDTDTPHATAILTVDVALLHRDDNDDLHIATITRGYEPHKGKRALPGGRVDEGEHSRHAAERETTEEIGIVLTDHNVGLARLRSFDTPGRDERGRTSSSLYVGMCDTLIPLKAASDADTAEWTPVDTLDLNAMAFDHGNLVAAALDWEHQQHTIDDLADLVRTYADQVLHEGAPITPLFDPNVDDISKLPPHTAREVHLFDQYHRMLWPNGVPTPADYRNNRRPR